MGISSQAISVKSSVNLSDINIDSDLDMGSKSILGYALSSLIKDYKLINLSTYDIAVENTTFSGEFSGSTTFPIGNTTTNFDLITGFGLYPIITSGEVKVSSSNAYHCYLRATKDDATATTNNKMYSSYIQFTTTTYTNILTTSFGSVNSYYTNNDGTIYINGQRGTDSIYFKNLILTVSQRLIPSNNFTLDDIDKNIYGVILNGGSFSINGTNIGTDYVTNRVITIPKISLTDTLQYSGNVIALID